MPIETPWHLPMTNCIVIGQSSLLFYFSWKCQVLTPWPLIFKHISVNNMLSISSEIALRWMQHETHWIDVDLPSVNSCHEFTDGKSTSIQVPFSCHHVMKTWTNVDQNPWHQMASPGSNELMRQINLDDIINFSVSWQVRIRNILLPHISLRN